ncbi:hypothetical protein GDO86_019697, partial [Hymenochirus boettgeri]
LSGADLSPSLCVQLCGVGETKAAPPSLRLIRLLLPPSSAESQAGVSPGQLVKPRETDRVRQPLPQAQRGQ